MATVTRRIFPASVGGFIDGRPLMPVDVTGEAEAVDWIEKRLADAVKQGNRVGWAQGQLKVIADTVNDGGQPELAKRIETVRAGLASPS